MITVFDYGAGNLRSVENTLAELGAAYRLVRDSEGIRSARKLILPGVGHFGQMMRSIDDMGVRQAFVDTIRSGIPFLGICLGLHGLFEQSEEAPEQRGFGIFAGTVKRFPEGARVPHMGWNNLVQQGTARLLAGLEPSPFVYFAHSFYVPETEGAVALCRYEQPFTAMFESGNVFGVQFHPEKSGPAGLGIVGNFASL